MSEEIELDYDYLMHKALRTLMRDVLEMVAELGDAPGAHHFYIEFATKAPGVDIPQTLQEEYPERMTIVLQHQFEDLLVEQDKFSVTLWFKGNESRLVIPFQAVTSFADPSVQFGLRFEPLTEEEADNDGGAQAETEASSDDKAAATTKADGDAEKKASDGADVVSLDAFRKK